MDDLRKRSIILEDWCCMCKCSSELVDHLLIHCSVARELWSFILLAFGVVWVMPHRLVNALFWWKGLLGHHRSSVLWCFHYLDNLERKEQLYVQWCSKVDYRFEVSIPKDFVWVDTCVWQYSDLFSCWIYWSTKFVCNSLGEPDVK